MPFPPSIKLNPGRVCDNRRLFTVDFDNGPAKILYFGVLLLNRPFIKHCAEEHPLWTYVQTRMSQAAAKMPWGKMPGTFP